VTDPQPVQVRSRRGSEPRPPGRGPRLSLRARLLLGYLLLLIAFGVVLTAVLMEMHHTRSSLAVLSAGYLPLARELGGAEATPLGFALERGQSAEVLYERRHTEEQFIGLKGGQLNRAYDLARAMADSDLAPGDAEVLGSMADQIGVSRDLLSTYASTHADLIAAYEAEEPTDVFVPALLDLELRLGASLRDLDRRVQRRIARVVQSTDRSQRDARFAVSALSAVAFGIGLLVVVATSFMLRPIRRLIVGAERLREGNFGERVEIRSGDEVGRLAEAFNAMAASLQEREGKLDQRTEELEAALAELREHQAALIRSERLATIGQMAAQIAHEVRNPLNALGLNADMLADEVRAGSAEEAAETVAAIKNEIARLTAVTEAYLALGRLPPLRLDPYPLSTFVRELIRFQAEEIDQAGVQVDLDLPDDLPEVQVDVGQLRQALLNILRNAVEALADGGGGTLKVAASEDGDEIRLDLEDDGPGMDAEHVARIFDPFFSTKERGSGLGLPITHQVIAEHGGRIECTSSLGEGTKFTIWLPRAKET